MPNPTAPVEIKRPIEIPWEVAQALLAGSSKQANVNSEPTEIQRPVQITMEEALAMVAHQPPPRAPLFVKSVVAVAVDPMDRRK